MKANWFSRVGLVLLMVVWALPCQSDCIPTINSTFNINGIVVGSAIGGGGAPPGTCLPDPGWGGVVALPFVPVSGIPDTHVSRLFVCGRAAGANLDRIYLGLHVENDDGFDFNDIVTFFFDVNNSGTFDTPDFALKIEIGPATPPTDENCNGSFNNLTYYKFVGGVWTQQALPTPTAIIAKTSWDYNGAAPDPESRLWELEVEIRPVDLATTVAVATGLKLGAKLAISEPGIGAMVLAYPMGLTADSSPAAMDPASGDVAAVRLATFDIGTCGPDVVIDSFTAVDTLGAPGKFTTFASAIPGNLPESQRNRFTAHVRFFNPANLADTSPVAVPNNGQVRFRGLPWSMGVGFTADIPLGEPTISFTHLGQIVVPAASWPENETQYSPFRAALAGADHICLKINLNGFNVNQNEPSDLVQQNLTFTRLSTIKESFLIKAARQETPGEKLDYLLRVRWQNLPTEMINPYPDRPKTNLWNFRFLNARQIGLKPIGNGYYRIQLRPSEEKKVEVVLSGGPMRAQWSPSSLRA